MSTEFRKQGWGSSKFKYALQPGTLLQNGKYTIIEILGQGLFTICYLARQNVFEKKVIINEFFLVEHCSRSSDGHVINENVNGTIYQDFREKWVEEPAIISKFTGNNHFVSIMDAFEENNTMYYISEYINEEDLQTFTLAQKEKHLEEKRAVNFIAQIADGLSFLHGNHFFHLDLCPVKVLIDKNDRAVIVNFGISRQNIPAEILDENIIPTKPGYSSPELYDKDGKYGIFSDIYSLGAILYFLVTGRDPMPAPERLHKSLPEPKSFSTSITRHTNSTIMKAMAMDPQDRYQNVNDFLRDLQDSSTKSVLQKLKKLFF
jgi:serine/threonine protein kinase